MLTKIRRGFLISLVVAGLVVISFDASHADTVNSVYDDLNRLIRVEYGTTEWGQILIIDIGAEGA
jgi:hypothetical protein